MAIFYLDPPLFTGDSNLSGSNWGYCTAEDVFSFYSKYDRPGWLQPSGRAEPIYSYSS